MDIISSISALRPRLANAGLIAFVPTMGNLHDGHLALVRLACQHGDTVVASIFVNPLQFGANEDFASYPRTLQADCDKLAAAGCDVVFTPNGDELYPTPQTVLVQPPAIAGELCGAHRPSHFQGVCTVVAKLFNIVQPQAAVFGSKDYQQLFILREMVRQLAFPIEIIAGATVREPDGLAMSSRNGYLRPAERKEAPRLYRALQQAVLAVQGGNRNFGVIEAQTTQYLTQLGWIVDYIALRSANTLLVPGVDERKLIILGAARLGKTRLIDNIEFAL
jgi:pantoate--beta-alanine ligase